MVTQTTEHEVLCEEYEHEPVSMMRLGIPMIITGANPVDTKFIDGRRKDHLAS